MPGVTDKLETEAVGAGDNRPVHTVTEISAALKRTVETEYAHVRVRGEVSGFKRAGSGHLYMSLKDADAVLDAVCWRGTASGLSIAPEDGMEVIATGRLTTYAGRSRYQIVVEALELAGEGALLKLLEERRRKLAAEGLFDAERKCPLPFLPEVIGVVTSPTGAVIRDILHRLADRFPRHVLLWPVLVQGDGAAEQIAAAIRGFNALAPGGAVPRPDLLIVARGGGSLEDLWAFNEEVVVRAAAASDIPLISAVGHETDTTLIDFASDFRAPTPTAAAERAVPVRGELAARVAENGARMMRAATRGLDHFATWLGGLARGLPDPRRIADEAAQRLDDRAERLRVAMTNRLRHDGASLNGLAARLRPRMLAQQSGRAEKSLAGLMPRLNRAVRRAIEQRRGDIERNWRLLRGMSYEAVLERGYAMVRDASGVAVMSAGALSPGDDVTITFGDGTSGARITGAPRESRPEGLNPMPRKPKSSDDPQGSLL
jgi:exodeoxyribonuclease VII large subunit